MKKRSKKRPEKQFRIAVVEEVADNIYSIKFILQSLGYDVSSFSYATGYISGLIEFSPHLILVDMMMPGRCGFLAIQDLKSCELKDIPVLAITADAMEGSVKEILTAGGQEVLGKPYSVADLQEKVKKWLPGTP